MKNWIALLASVAVTCAHAQWKGEVVNDPLTEQRAYVQWTARSANSLALAPPYEGENRGTLIQRVGKVPGGMSLVLSVDKGQFVCPVAGCAVRIRYGDKPPVSVDAKRAPDGSPNVIVMQTMAEPAAELILVEAMLYREGPQVLRFETPGGAPRPSSISKPNL